MSDEKQCCAPFNPEPWRGREMSFEHKIFLKDHVVSFLHMPLNMGSRMTKCMALLEAAGSTPSEHFMLTDEKSPWGADLYIEATKEVPGATMAKINGRFLTQVFDGPYRELPRFIAEMQKFVTEKGHVAKRLLFYYTTCPKCAVKYGHNYVVICAEI